jgi:anti-anti-sigma factor
MATAVGPLLHAVVEQGVLILTITQESIQGEEIAHKLREEMRLAVEQAGIQRVVVDLHNTRYMSSVAFWPLLSLRKQLLEAGGRLLICGLSEDIEDIFRTTRMINSGGETDAPFEVAPDAAAAVARLLGDPAGG